MSTFQIDQYRKVVMDKMSRTELAGKMYEARKNTQGGDRRSEEFSNGQNVHLKDRREIKDGTAGKVVWSLFFAHIFINRSQNEPLNR